MSLYMPRHLNIPELFSKLQKSANEETALAITQAFEQFNENQQIRISANRNDLLAEINITDLATKKDLEIGITQLEAKMATQLELANFETRMYKHISDSKWQVIGTIGFFFFSTIIAKHIGLF